MKKLITLIGFCLLFTGGVYAQKTAPKIDSVYTGLDKGCKAIGGDEHDNLIDCKGLGGYRIIFTPAAALQQILVRKNNEEDILIASVSYEFKEKGRKVEWRTANGKPFAVIMRVDKYADATAEEQTTGQYLGKKIGELLVVRGLKGFGEEMDFEIDVKTPGANAKAREMADKAYLKTVK